MNAIKGPATRPFREMRQRDPFMDRRSGEDRRKVYSLDYFQMGNRDRRMNGERRKRKERRADCIRISEWSSVCPNYEDQEYREGRIVVVDLSLKRHGSLVS
jgi:hypothetical protein